MVVHLDLNSSVLLGSTFLSANNGLDIDVGARNLGQFAQVDATNIEGLIAEDMSGS